MAEKGVVNAMRVMHAMREMNAMSPMIQLT
jgi:hypothetical protein